MYSLSVYYPGVTAPRDTEHPESANAALSRIPELLAAHPGCDRIVISTGSTRLFAIDCVGNRLPD